MGPDLPSQKKIRGKYSRGGTRNNRENDSTTRRGYTELETASSVESKGIIPRGTQRTKKRVYVGGEKKKEASVILGDHEGEGKQGIEYLSIILILRPLQKK